jgi:hypothetical protein
MTWAVPTGGGGTEGEEPEVRPSRAAGRRGQVFRCRIFAFMVLAETV